MNITILGAGAFGKALGQILSENQHELKYYDPYIYPELSLEQACENCQALIIATPSAALPELVPQIPDTLHQVPVILATKGLCDSSLFADFPQFSAISGPAFADEILAGKPATFTASAPFAMGLFQNDRINVELCDDVEGIILGGTLKNIYAIGAGYHSSSENSEAVFIQHAHSESKSYFKQHGANPETAELACGLGDLILTCTNTTSRNYRCGQMLAEGKTLDEIRNELGPTIEGLDAAFKIDADHQYPLLRRIAKRCGRHFDDDIEQ